MNQLPLPNRNLPKAANHNPFVCVVSIPHFGDIGFRPLDLDRDVPMIHDWVNRDYAKFWGLQHSSVADVRREYERLTAPAHYDVFIGEHNGQAAFLMERYHPAHDLIGTYYEARPGDCGIHLMVAPAKNPQHGFTQQIFNASLAFIFREETVQRILIEPDIRNEKMHRLSKRIGFAYTQVLDLPHKTAYLAFYTRHQFQANQPIISIQSPTSMHTSAPLASPQQAIAHIQPDVWAKANTLLIKKAIGEFAHELLLTPQLVEEKEGWGYYRLATDQAGITYRFRAKRLAMNHWYIDTDSLQKFDNHKNVALDAILFIKECKSSLGIDPKMLPTYLEEIISTLSGSAYKLVKGNPTAQELAVADFQTIEQAMTEGHPGFVANNGRIGFDAHDYLAYAPEAGKPFSLVWLAGHVDRAVYAGTQQLPYATLIEQELGAETVQAFNQILTDRGLNPESYVFIPVHPWQWFNKLAAIFAPELALGKLVCLGYSPDQYQAQQSIRTLFNLTNPHKFYTKTSLSILNMGFMRGLPLYYLGTAPEMAVWLENLLSQDAYIQETGFTMLGEVASISYVNPYYEEFGKHNGYNKMLASLWRESPLSAIRSGQSLMTMAAFLHIDQYGNALLPELIKASGMGMDDWLAAYLKAYLSPLLHCFYQYDLVFMPHGENLIMVLENHVPVKALLKDITEEAVILNPAVKLPPNLERMYAQVPDDVKLLSIFTDVFDGFFRFLSPILVEHANYPEERFWELVAESVYAYQTRYPQLEEKFAYYDLFADDFQLSCLNRLQLRNNQQMIDLDDPVALLQFVGRLKNPLAAFKRILTEEQIAG